MGKDWPLCAASKQITATAELAVPISCLWCDEKGHVLFLCLLLYNIKMYPVLSKEPQGLCFWCRLRSNLVTPEIQRNGGQKTADLWRTWPSRSLDESPLKTPEFKGTSNFPLVARQPESAAAMLGAKGWQPRVVEWIVGWITVFHSSEVPLHGRLTVTMIQCHLRIIIQPLCRLWTQIMSTRARWQDPY